MSKTTIAGFITAIISLAIWIAGYFFKLVIPAEISTFVIGLLISIVALFTDPNSFREVGPKVLTGITLFVTVLSWLLKTAWGIIPPPGVFEFIQAVLIFVLSFVLKDASIGSGSSLTGKT